MRQLHVKAGIASAHVAKTDDLPDEKRCMLQRASRSKGQATMKASTEQSTKRTRRDSIVDAVARRVSRIRGELQNWDDPQRFFLATGMLHRARKTATCGFARTRSCDAAQLPRCCRKIVADRLDSAAKRKKRALAAADAVHERASAPAGATLPHARPLRQSLRPRGPRAAPASCHASASSQRPRAGDQHDRSTRRAPARDGRG